MIRNVLTNNTVSRLSLNSKLAFTKSEEGEPLTLHNSGHVGIIRSRHIERRDQDKSRKA